MRIKQIVCIAVCFVILLCMTSCYTEWMPQEGSWYCVELQIQISFDGGEIFAFIDGEKVPCVCINDPGSIWFSVLSQGFNIEGIPVGTELLSAKRVDLTESKFIVAEEKTGKEYTFVRVS